MKSLRMRSSACYLLLALLGACFTAGMASGQNSKGQLSRWGNLKSLARGQEILVVMNNIKSHKGKFESVSGSGIMLRQEKVELTLARKDVFRVSQMVGQDHHTRNAVAGMVVGAGAGLVTGLIANHVIWSHVNCTLGPDFACGYPPNPHWGYILTPVGGLAGAALGSLLPTGGWHDVYRAR